jgi:hypothetical protein
MNGRPSLPAGATVFTDRLTGASLDELLEAAGERRWPEQRSHLTPEWDLLRAWAIQTESLELDEAENMAWEQAMRELNHRDLPYGEWIEERTAALKDRLRARKLAQANVRYKYGYRGKRSTRLIRSAVRECYQRWSDPGGDV